MANPVIECVKKNHIIAIVRGADFSKCDAIADALYEGGIRLMEITYSRSNPDISTETAKTIGSLAERFMGEMFIGAGTVTSPELAELTAANGGSFMAAPNTDINVISKAKELGLCCIPGAMTPTEILTAHSAGADAVKLFPAGDLGPGYLKSIRAPISDVDIIAFGGINRDNLGVFLRNGAIGAGISSVLIKREWLDNSEYRKITDAARSLTEVLNGLN